VFGGSFDPVHLGHLVPAVRACETFSFDALHFVPAGRPPHRSSTMAPFAHRFAMLALATAPHDRLLVSDVELAGDGPTYTVETLQRFRRSTAADHLYFVLGSDSFAQIATWHRWQELVELAHLVVLHRDTAWSEELRAAVPEALHARLRTVTPGAAVPDPPPGRREIYLLDHEPFPISATGLRERLRAGAAIDELVPPEVGRYIAKHRLYRHGGDERHA
jgi:nicotinate-nucleotide adenylyltransferase